MEKSLKKTINKTISLNRFNFSGFSSSNNGGYHWSGGSGDSKNPLPIPKDLKF